MNKIYIIQDLGSVDSSNYASNVMTRDIRLQGENVEKILVNYYEQLKNLDGIVREKQNEDDLYETLLSQIGDIESEISVIKQSSDKIDFVVKTVDGTSELTITDNLIEAVSESIRITAENIDLCGYVSNRTVIDENGIAQVVEGNWSIDNDGNANFQDLGVNDTLSCDTLVVTNIENPQYVKSLTGNLDLYIDATDGDDNAVLEDGAVFQSMKGLLDVLPKSLNGNEITITLRTDISERMNFEYFSTGRIRVFLNGKTVKGYLRIYSCDVEIRMYGGANSEDTTIRGVFMPSKLYSIDNICTTVYINKSNKIGLYYTDFYGSATNTISHGLCVTNFSNARLTGIAVYDSYHGVQALSLSRIYCSKSSGYVQGIAWRSSTAGIIYLTDAQHLGGVTLKEEKLCGQVIVGEGATPDSTDSGNKNTENPTGDSSDESGTIKTVTYKATAADTYRSTVYNNWKEDGTVRQGDWGYGDCNGCWFFGSQFSKLKGKTINSVKITIKRQTGGYSTSSVQLKIKAHNHSSRPSGEPSFLSGWSKTTSVLGGNSITVTITDTTILDAIKNGKIKGFGLQHTYDKSHYAVCSGSAKVVITYVE